MGDGDGIRGQVVTGCDDGSGRWGGCGCGCDDDG